MSSSPFIENELQRLPTATASIHGDLLSKCSIFYNKKEINELKHLFAWIAYADGQTTLTAAQTFLNEVLASELVLEAEVMTRLSQYVCRADHCNIE
jgi:hypothetical protein